MAVKCTFVHPTRDAKVVVKTSRWRIKVSLFIDKRLENEQGYTLSDVDWLIIDGQGLSARVTFGTEATCEWLA